MDTLSQLALIVRLRDMFSGPAKRLVGTLQDLQEAAKKSNIAIDLGSKLSMAGGQLSQVAAQSRGAIQAMVQPFVAFEEGVARLSTVIQPVAGDARGLEGAMKDASEAARAWGRTHSQSAEEFLATTYIMAGAGLDAQQAIAGTGMAIKVAAATMGSATDAANLLSIMYNNVGDKTRDVGAEMQRLGDLVTQTQGIFQIADFAQLKGGLTYALPAGLRFRVELEQVMATLGQLNNAGLQGEQAGTAFEAMMAKLDQGGAKLGFAVVRAEDGTLNLLETLKGIKGQFGDVWDPKTVQAFTKEFGEQGIRGLMPLLQHVEEMEANLQKLRPTQAAGATDTAFAKMEGTSAAELKKGMNQLRDAAIEVGAALMPIITGQFLPWLKDTVKGIAAWVQEHPNLTAYLAKFTLFGTVAASILGPIMQLGGGMLSFVGVAAKAIGPITKLGSGIKNLAKRGAEIVDAFSAFGKYQQAEGVMSLRDKLGKFAGWLRDGLGSALGKAGDLFKSLFRGMLRGARAAFAYLAANPVVFAVLAIVAAVALLIVYWDEVQAAVVDFYDKTVSALQSMGRRIKAFFVGLWDGAADLSGRVTRWLGGVLSAWVDWVDAKKAAIYEGAVKLWKGLGESLEAMILKLRQMWQGFLNWWVDNLNVFDIGEGTSLKQAVTNMTLKSEALIHDNNMKLRERAAAAQVAAPGRAPAAGPVEPPPPVVNAWRLFMGHDEGKKAQPAVTIGTVIINEVKDGQDLVAQLRRRGAEAAVG